jgi:hypothetical protein
MKKILNIATLSARNMLITQMQRCMEIVPHGTGPLESQQEILHIHKGKTIK